MNSSFTTEVKSISLIVRCCCAKCWDGIRGSDLLLENQHFLVFGQVHSEAFTRLHLQHLLLRNFHERLPSSPVVRQLEEELIIFTVLQQHTLRSTFDHEELVRLLQDLTLLKRLLRRQSPARYHTVVEHLLDRHRNLCLEVDRKLAETMRDEHCADIGHQLQRFLGHSMYAGEAECNC